MMSFDVTPVAHLRDESYYGGFTGVARLDAVRRGLLAENLCEEQRVSGYRNYSIGTASARPGRYLCTHRVVEAPHDTDATVPRMFKQL